MCVCDTRFMSDSTRIESIYEPGFGPTGPQKPEDLIMVENNISVYGVKKERAEKYQDALKRGGWGDYESKDIILFAGQGDSNQKQTLIAMNSVINSSMVDPLFPKVMTRRDFDGGYSTSEVSPIQAVDLSEGFSHTNTESGIKIPLTNVVLLKRREASDDDYDKARSMIIQKTNIALQIFNTDFRIPQFPNDDKLKRI